MKSLSKFALFVCILSVAGCGNSNRLLPGPEKDVIVLYENDVHCAVDGYAAFAALKDEMKVSHRFVTTVSCGDFVQGASLGAASHGRYMIDIMNEVGYDFVTLGNHEFDFGIPRQQELMSGLSAECLCCNFKDLRTGEVIYAPYRIVHYGGLDVAFIGMSTPYTINSSTPSYFKDENGRYIYSFCGDDFCDVVQQSVDRARAEGADMVVAISHIGDETEGEGLFNSLEMIAGTHGIDVVLDGHSHSTYAARMVRNDKGEEVTLTSTGTKFHNMGVLTIHPDGSFNTSLVPTEFYPRRDSWIEKVVQGIKDGYRKIAEQVIFTSDVRLGSYDTEGKRLCRNQECNIGDFCADAYRIVLDADMGMMGGGSIRADLPEGEVTFNDIYTMFPFENGACKAFLTGALILDALEYSVSLAPAEFGGFLHVSGLRFEYDSSIPTPVMIDTKHNFSGIIGERRVRKVEILDKASGKYVPLDPSRTYTVATSSYLAKDCGDGYTMMADCSSIEDSGILDTDIIQRYVENYKDRHVGEEYAGTEGRIKDTGR